MASLSRAAASASTSSPAALADYADGSLSTIAAASAADLTGGRVEDAISTVDGADNGDSDEAFELEIAFQKKDWIEFLDLLQNGLPNKVLPRKFLHTKRRKQKRDEGDTARVAHQSTPQ